MIEYVGKVIMTLIPCVSAYFLVQAVYKDYVSEKISHESFFLCLAIAVVMIIIAFSIIWF